MEVRGLSLPQGSTELFLLVFIALLNKPSHGGMVINSYYKNIVQTITTCDLALKVLSPDSLNIASINIAIFQWKKQLGLGNLISANAFGKVKKKNPNYV